MLELSVQRPTVHMQRYFYKKTHTAQSWIDDDIPIPFAKRQKSVNRGKSALSTHPPLFQLASLFPMGCLGGDQIRFNFGVKIKYSLNTLRQHLAYILDDETTWIKSIFLGFYEGFFSEGDSHWANHDSLTMGSYPAVTLHLEWPNGQNNHL